MGLRFNILHLKFGGTIVILKMRNFDFFVPQIKLQLCAT